MAGRHSKQERMLGGKAAAGVLAVLLLGGAAVGGYQLLSNEDSGEESGAQAASPSISSGTTASPESAPSGSTSSPPSQASSSSTSTPAAAAPLSTGCRTQLAAGSKVVQAADQSYRDWKGHTQADLDYRSGKNSWAKTQGIWADTKSRGEKDVAAFTSAHGTYVGTSSGGCTAVDRESASDEVKKCLTRFTLMDDVIAKGRKVNSDWNAHLQMMKRKDHTNARTYTKEWRTMVDGAGANQNAYDKARAAYAKAPACVE